MCEQLKVLAKIRKAKKMNGYSVSLAEATARDYVVMKKRLDTIEIDVQAIKTEQAVQGGKLDLIIQRLNSPVEKEREDGIFWSQIKNLLKTTTGKIVLLLLLGSIALAGQRILELIGLIK